MARVDVAAVEAGHRLRRVVLAALLAKDDLHRLLGVLLLAAAVVARVRLGRDRLATAAAERDLVDLAAARVPGSPLSAGS